MESRRSITPLVELCFNFLDAFQHCIKGWNRPEYHAGHRRIVATQISDHGFRRRQSKRAGVDRSQAKVGAVEKHPGMADAITPEFGIGQRDLPYA